MSVHPLPQIVDFLLPNDALIVIEIFRAIEIFRGDYESSALTATTADLSRIFPRETAEGLVSDALLIDSELRSRGHGRYLGFNAGAATASVHEAALLNLIAGMQHADYCGAAEAAIQLDVLQARVLFSLAFRFAERLGKAGVRLVPRSARGTIAPGSSAMAENKGGGRSRRPSASPALTVVHSVD